MAKKILYCTNVQRNENVFKNEESERRFGRKVNKAKSFYEKGCLHFFEVLSKRIQVLEEAGYSPVDATRKALIMELADNNISAMMYHNGKHEVSKYFKNLEHLPELETVMTGMSLLEALETGTLQ